MANDGVKILGAIIAITGLVWLAYAFTNQTVEQCTTIFANVCAQVPNTSPFANTTFPFVTLLFGIGIVVVASLFKPT